MSYPPDRPAVQSDKQNPTGPPPNGTGAAPNPGGAEPGPELSAALAAAVQAERERIAQALHDTVAQTLTGTYLRAVVTTRKLKTNGSKAADEMAQVTALIQQAVNELHAVLGKMRPGVE